MAKAKSDLAKAEEAAAALSGEKVAKTSSKKEQVESFYEFDNNKFATKEDLDKAMRDSFMMRSDYTQKTQTLAEDRKRIEQLERDIRMREENAKRLEADYKRYDQFVRSNPQVYRELEQRVARGMSPTDFKEQFKEELEGEWGMPIKELQEFVKSYKADQARNEAYTALSEKYGDKFNKDNVEKLMDELYAGDMSTLGEMLHFAHLGRSATQSEMNEDRPSGATSADTIPSGGGVATIPTTETTPKTFDEAEDMAKAELGITEEDYD